MGGKDCYDMELIIWDNFHVIVFVIRKQCYCLENLPEQIME